MGFMLREALRTLCGENQWCYAVFWKIGCQNTKLLIWEECHFEPPPRSVPPYISGNESLELPFGAWEECWVSSEIRCSQLGIQAGDRVQSLIKKMMMNNQVNMVGEGIVGRAAFMGTHQWILANNYVSNSHPPEVLNEVHLQFSAGMQTIAVIPVLPHGVVQLGSSLAIMENTRFVNDVRSLILQLGCVPGALLSENYATEEAAQKIGLPVSLGMPVSVEPSGNHQVTTSTPLMTESRNQQSNSSQAIRLVGQPLHSLIRQSPDNPQTAASTFHTPNLTQPSARYHDNHCKLKLTPVTRPNFHSRGQLENLVIGAEVIPANLNVWLNQQASSGSSRPGFNYQPGIDQSGASHSSLKLMEQQIFSDASAQDHVNNNINASTTSITSQIRTNGGLIFDAQRGSLPTHWLEGRELYCGTSGHLRPISVPCSLSNLQKSADINLSSTHLTGIGLQKVDSSRAEEVPLSSLVDQLSSSHMLSGGSDPRHNSSDVKDTQIESAPKKEMIDNDLFQALNIPLTHPDEQISWNEQIPTFIQDCLKHDSRSSSPRSANSKYEVACSPSGEDLFDIFGVDFKNKLLNENWNNLLADGPNAKVQNLGKKTSTFMNKQDLSSDFFPVTEGLSDSGIFSGMSTDNLLDAVVSRAHSASNQNSDDNVSCKTTLTKISSSSVPSSSPTYGQISMSDKAQGELFGLPKSLAKAGTTVSTSFRSGCNKDDAGSCSQTTSIYTSQISSWVEQGHNVKRDSSVSTAYSKRNDDMSRSNRKRLKPGENPRPRPKDRQMIQDRVKELREIVPNGAKCSIDALLERTIKHMLFLQSVTKHADKLKQTGESKIINKEGGLLLKDNFEGGATWAFEVGSQSMVCPIIVEDLNPPRQMLVEMLCEERGFFLEIADLIRGMGLTILKGVMEARNDKIWARFAVEANRDIKRMEIFMSLVQLLEQTAKGGSTLSANALVSNNMMAQHSFPQAASIPATGRHGCLQ